MRKAHIVVSILALLGLAALIGTHVLAACVLALGIVASYGITVRVLLCQRVGERVLATLLSTTAAIAGVWAGVGLVYLWSAFVQYPFLSSLALWAAIFGGGATWALIATSLERHGRVPKMLRAIYH